MFKREVFGLQERYYHPPAFFDRTIVTLDIPNNKIYNFTNENFAVHFMTYISDLPPED